MRTVIKYNSSECITAERFKKIYYMYLTYKYEIGIYIYVVE